MLNNKTLSAILNCKLPSLNIKNIHWRAEESDSESILFYKVGSAQKDKDSFLMRVQNSKYALLVINQKIDPMPFHSVVVEEEQWPKIQKEILDILFPLPSMKMVGITGTNGKTTTTDLVLQMGHLMGKKGLSIGTLGVREYNKTILDFGLTSPSLIDLRKFLHTYGQDKDFCVMEASSHALVQNRLFGIVLDCAGWPSFSQDHLDYHKTMDAYFRAKCIIFEMLDTDAKLFVPKEQADLFKKLRAVSTKAHLAEEISAELPIFFRTQFNKNNLEVACSIIVSIFDEKFNKDFSQLIPPDGRFFIRHYRSNYIVVDFAHTPDALDNVCRGIRESFPGFKLKVLFGCGGDRDRSKRAQMGEVVSRWADFTYLTSDNPRSEDPGQIISDIRLGMTNQNFREIVERPKAVEIALNELAEKEILLLAGKGHEDYIIINGTKHPYSDIQEVEKFIARNS